MMSSSIYHYQTENQHSAQAIGSGNLPVLSTPSLIAFMENACFNYCQLQLSQNDTTVGSEIAIQHIAASKIGETIDIIITSVQQNNRVFTFSVEAYCGTTLIGKGTHTRISVSIEKFMNKL